MRNFKRFLSYVLVCAMLLTSVSCLGGVFSVAASAADPTFTNLVGYTTSPGQHGTIQTAEQLDAAHPSGWMYLYGETYELPAGATLGSDWESNITPTDGYVKPGQYVIVKTGYANSSGFLTGMPLFWLAHSYDFFENIAAPLATQDVANNAASGQNDMANYGAQLNWNSPYVTTSTIGLNMKVTTFATPASTPSANVTKSGYTAAQLDTIGFTNLTFLGSTMPYAGDFTWVAAVAYKVKAGLADGTMGSLFIPQDLSDATKGFWKLPNTSGAIVTKHPAYLSWSNLSDTTAKLANFFTGDFVVDYGATFCIGDNPNAGDDIDPALRARGDETYTNLIGQTTGAGQHGTIQTAEQLDAAHPSGWMYLYGETYELPEGATLGSDWESNITPTDGYVMPGQYVIVKTGYANSSGFLTGMPLFWLAHSYDFFENIAAPLATQDVANNAASGQNDMANYGAQLNWNSPYVTTSTIGLNMKVTTFATPASTPSANVTKSGYTAAQLDTIGFTNLTFLGSTMPYAGDFTWVAAVAYKVKAGLSVGTTGSLFIPQDLSDATKGFWKLPNTSGAIVTKHPAYLSWSNLSDTTAKLANFFTGDFVIDYGATFVVGYPPAQGGGDTTYTATFYDADGSTVLGTKANIAAGGTVDITDAPAVTAPAHSEFDCWTDMSGAAVSFPVTVNSDISFKAKYASTIRTITTIVDGVATDYSFDKGAAVSGIPDPSKNGATFAGWNPALPATMPDGNITVTATWNITNYTLTINYVMADGTTAPTAYVDSTLTYNASYYVNSPAVTGYTASPATVSGNITANTTVTVTYSPRTYTVYFMANGSQFASQQVVFGTNILDPGEPNIAGRPFQGWKDAQNNTVTFPMRLTTEGATFTADLGSQSFTVSLFGEDADNAYDTASYTYGDALYEPTRPVWSDGGMRCIGWKYGDGTPVASWPITVEGDVALYAIWEAKGMYVDFYEYNEDYINGGDYNYGDEIEDIAPDYTPVSGMNFVGWAIYEDGQIGEIVTTVPYTVDEYIGLIAVFEDANYTITFMQGDTVIGTQTGKAGAAINAPSVAPSTGYRVEWADINGVAMPATIQDNATYYATYVANEYLLTIHYVKANGTEAFADHTENVAYDDTYLVTSPSLTGYTPDTATVSGTMDNINGKEITVTYTPNIYTLTINYVYADSTQAAPSHTEQVAFDAPYSVTSPEVSGFNADYEIVSGIMDTVGGKTITVTYSAGTFRLTINYLYADSTVAHAPYIENIAHGESYSIASPAITGYTPDIATVSGTINNAAVTVDVTYSANAHTITWIVDGVAIRTDNTFFGEAIVAPTASKTGYTFAAWNPAPAATVPDDDVTYTATFNPNPYALSITYVMSDNTPAPAPYSGDVYYDATFSVNSPEVAGYTPDTATVSGTMDSTAGKTYTVTYEPNEYIVVFNLNGGNVNGDTNNYEVLTVFNTKPAAPTPEKLGYVFAGWDRAVSKLTIVGDREVVYTAVWTEAGDTPYTVHVWEMNTEGVYENEDIELTGVTGTYIDLTQADPAEGFYYDRSHAGFNAAGTIAADGSLELTLYVARSSYDITVTYVMADGTTAPTAANESALYEAEYSIASPAVTGYTPNIATVSGEMGAEDVTVTVTYTPDVHNISITYTIPEGLPASVTAPQAYSGTAAYGTTYSVTSPVINGLTADTLVVTGTMGTADVDVEVTYTANDYTITYMVEGVEYAADTYAYGAAVTAPDDPEVTGKEFSGWNPEVPATMPAEDITIVAQFGTSKFTFTYTIDGVSKSTDYFFGAAVPTVPAPRKDGFTFAGWSPEWPATMPANNLEVVAQWTRNTYTLTTVVDGESTEYLFAYEAQITGIPTPVKTGATFSRWDPAIPANMPANDVVVTAIWATNSYTVTWTIDGATSTTSVDHGATPVAPSASKTGYSFDGWFVTGDDTQEVLETLPAITADCGFTAKFSINTYHAYFDLAGGNIDGSTDTVDVPTVYGEAIAAPDDPEKTGYIFAGWSPEVSGNIGAADVTYTAQWTQDTSYCTVKRVDRTVTGAYTETAFANGQAAEFKIYVEGSPKRLQIYKGTNTTSSWNYTASSGKVISGGDQTGVVSIEAYEGEYLENPGECWTIWATIPAGEFKVRAKTGYTDDTWEEVANGKDFTVEFDEDTTSAGSDVDPVVSVSADKTSVKRGDTVTWTVVTNINVTLLQFKCGDNTTGYSSSVCTTVDDSEAGTRTWTITMKMTYADITKDQEVQAYTVNYLTDTMADWEDSGAEVPEITVTKYADTEVTEVGGEEVDPYSILSTQDATGTKLQYTALTITTTSDVSKIRLTVSGKKATYTASSTNATVTDNNDGTATWVINYRFTAAGDYTVGVESRGNTWTNCSTDTIAATIS